jgi:hypothetical protein
MLRGWGCRTSFSGGLCACVVFITSFFLGDSSACLGQVQVTNLNPGQSIDLAQLLNSNPSSVQIGDKVFGEFSVVPSDTNALAGDDLQLTALSNQIGFGISLYRPHVGNRQCHQGRRGSFLSCRDQFEPAYLRRSSGL